MTLVELLTIIFPPGQPNRPTPEQEAILRHPQGPGWVLAGPGSGKTEVLTLLVLRLLYVENDPVQFARVPPESIFVTTFTEKAARNLEDRISHYRNQIIAQRPALSAIDTSKLRLGTLHGLCNDLLQEFRAPNYQNVRLMDELEANMFVYEHVSIVDDPNDLRDRPFWTHFAYLFSLQQWQPTWTYLPSKWNMAAALVKLFNRIVEDRVSVSGMRAAGSQWTRLADLYNEYAAKLQAEHRCDFSHLQLRFLEFLQTPLGRQFRDGDPGDNTAGIAWVLVDEYQDTNLIQEDIYLTLANRAPHNVVVVGDDDQALYRFRGGSVECMVTFDQACRVYLGVLPGSVARYPLVANFRSHPGIVSFCNSYIRAFASMALPGARVPNKPALISRSLITGTHPSVGQLRATSMNELVDKFADTVRDLVSNGVVQDYNQCCLLLKSTRESPNNAQKYVAALRARGIPVYNPRNKGFLEQEEVLGLLGALLAITDSQGRHVPQRPQDLSDLVANSRGEYARLATANPRLAQYAARANASIAARPGAFLTANLQELVYYVMSLPPFDGWPATQRDGCASRESLPWWRASHPCQYPATQTRHVAGSEHQRISRAMSSSSGVLDSITCFLDIFRGPDSTRTRMRT
jgi:DNA helicase-2/ATP-dependent DNA helicase PcrA